MLENQRVVADQECCPQFPLIARQHFLLLDALNRWQATVAHNSLRLHRSQLAAKFSEAIQQHKQQQQQQREEQQQQEEGGA